MIGGISAGANLAAVISHLYRDEQMSPPLTGTYLSIPILLSPEAVPEKYKDQYLSREQNKTAPILNKEALDLFKGMALPVKPSEIPLMIFLQRATKKTRYHHLHRRYSFRRDTKACPQHIFKSVAWILCATSL